MTARRKTYPKVSLTPAERKEIKALLGRKKLAPWAVKAARALVMLDAGVSPPAVIPAVELTPYYVNLLQRRRACGTFGLPELLRSTPWGRMGSKPLPPISLTRAQIEELEVASRSHEMNGLLAKRARVILQVAQGGHLGVLAKQAAVTSDALKTARNLYIDGGVEALRQHSKGRHARSVTINAVKRKALEAATQSSVDDGWLATKAKAILLAGCGMQDTDVAKRLDVTAGSVSRWRIRYRARGLQGLLIGQRGNPNPVDTASIKLRLTHLLTTTPPPGLSRWTTEAMAAALGVSAHAITRTWSTSHMPPLKMGRPRKLAA